MQTFKIWLNELYLNPLYYDMSTPEGRAEYQQDKEEAGRFRNQAQKQEVGRQPHQEPFVLRCWRGCTLESLEMMTVERGPSYIVLDASRSRSGAIWFAHQFQTGGNDYANNHGSIIITYPLKCNSYYDIAKYSDGQAVKEPSKKMVDKVHVYSECPYGIFGNAVIELPAGWTFSEHGEKHVICVTKVVIQNSMITNV